MAHFYGSMEGSRGEATRCGTEKSGITAHVRGWNIGCRAGCFSDAGGDYVEIIVTSGSNGAGLPLRLGTFRMVDGKIVRDGGEV